jgi:alpha-galactosidase
MNGLKLKQQFMGTWYNDQTRIMGDFGSQLYIIEKKA